jgi:GxxExxY protein
MTENMITYKIRGAIFDVYNAFGPGLLESIYTAALEMELTDHGLKVRREVPVPVFYKGRELGLGLRLDLLVEEQVLVEVKSIQTLEKVHHKQVITYLKITGLRLGILVNFNVDDISAGIIRKVNGY